MKKMIFNFLASFLVFIFAGSLTSTGAYAEVNKPPIKARVVQNCPYLSHYLKLGGKNDPAQVLRLQQFLRDAEKLDVEMTGMFDLKTFEAVKAFQIKYAKDIMGPWGASIPSGQVYISTLKKINEINCKNASKFNSGELAIFEKYKSMKNKDVHMIEVAPTIAGGENQTIDIDSSSNIDILNMESGESNGENEAAAVLSVSSDSEKSEKSRNFFKKFFRFIFSK